MGNQLFRKKSMEHISSPDNISDYMHVTNPRLWMLLSAIALFLVGFVVYASTVTMENVMPLSVRIETFKESDNQPLENPVTFVYAALPKNERSKVAQGMKLRVAGEEGRLNLIYEYDDIVNLEFEMEKQVLDLPDGTYDGVLVLEEETPISFLFD